MGIPILWFRLEGPLQSWGERSHWDYRDTAQFPSKSGVIGLLACALGWERDDSRIGELSDELTMSVRADRSGELLVDYHTVTAEVLRSAAGTPRSGSNTIQTYRSYLQDASFLVGLTGSRERLEMLKDALEHPVWVVYLGRKCCVPSVPVLGKITEEYDSLRDAMYGLPLAERLEKGTETVLIESDSGDGSGYNRTDLRAASAERRYQSRRVTVEAMKIPKPEEKNDVSQ